MNRDVVVKIESQQNMADEQTEHMSSCVMGKFYEKDGEYIILYEEVQPETKAAVKNRLRITEEGVQLRKSGAVTWEMHFQEGKRKEADYHTGFGPLSMAVTTENICKLETEEHIHLRVRYQLEIQGQHHADCEIEISIKAASSAGL